MGYKVTNELNSFELHDAILCAITFSGCDMQWIVKDAIVVGTSRPDMEGSKTCTQNSGEDRYAVPFLRLTFQNFQLKSFIRCGCSTYKWKIIKVQKRPKHLKLDEFKPYAETFVEDDVNTIYALTMKNNIIHADFWGASNSQYYSIEFTAENSYAEWESFGRKAWYLK